MSNYNFDTNRIISVAKIESFSLQLEHFLSSQDELAPQTDKVISMTIELLYGLLQEQDNQDIY